MAQGVRNLFSAGIIAIVVAKTVGTILTYVGAIPTLYVMCMNLSYKTQQCGNISNKIS